MFKSIIPKLSITCLVLVTLFSCENDTALVEGTPLSDNITPVLNFPERVPADAHLNTLMMSGETDWKIYDDYYKKEVLSQQDEPFFHNLQWSTIAFIVNGTDFLENAASDSQSYYINEILNRSYVNKPSVVVSLLRKQQAEGVQEHQLAKIARSVLDINKKHLSEENFKKHQDRNQVALNELFNFGYDRWGQEK